MDTNNSAKKEDYTPPADIYPKINIPLIQNPSKFYAIPILGFLVKIFAIIPVAIVILFLSLFFIIVTLINSFYVLFTGKYWPFAYNYNLGLIKLNTKVYFYFTGLTDKYPGFDFKINDNYSVEMPMPENPSRFFAIPVIGGLVRAILLIPYAIYAYVLQSAAGIAYFISFVPVLFMGKYLESTYELIRDYNRVNVASSAYMMGLSDKYPSFWISMNHKTAKIILIILGIILMIMNFSSSFTSSKKQANYNYQQDVFQQLQQENLLPEELPEGTE